MGILSGVPSLPARVQHIFSAVPYVPLLAVLFTPAAGFGATALITSIHFSGNATTKERVLRQEMAVREGDLVDPAAIERSRQAIMDLGLFKSVRADLVDEADGQQLLITVDEKYYFLPIPRLDGKPSGDFQYGLEMRFDNLAGLNQRLRLLYRINDTVDGEEPEQREVDLGYHYPRIAGTPYNVSINGGAERQERTLDEEAQPVSRYLWNERHAGFSVSRWLHRNGFITSHGWNTSLGLAWNERDIRLREGEVPPLEVGQTVSLTGGLQYDAVREHAFYRSGRAYGYGAEVGLPFAGSDYSYVRNLLHYRGYQPLGQNRNLNWRLQFGFGEGTPFGTVAYRLGGRELRGYDHGYAQGNAFLLANTEYLRPFNGQRHIRGVLFLDTGNAYENIGAMDLGTWHTGVGIGLRWQVQSLVDVNVSFDWGYGLGSGTSFTFLNTSGTF